MAQQSGALHLGLRDKVNEKIEELVAMDIIEPVEGPTPWVSPVVVVPKQNDEIRLCVDMQRANETTVRERYPIPTVDEVLQSLHQSTVFSKLDLKWGYHQLELHPDSRSITTFTTHCGLYQYKRLMFGITSAPKCTSMSLSNDYKVVKVLPTSQMTSLFMGRTLKIAASFGEAEREESHVESSEVQVPHDPDGLHGTGIKRQ